MSEQLLEAVILLFSMLARLDSAGEEERSKMLNLLQARLNKEVVGRYMKMFDQLCQRDIAPGSNPLEEIRKIAAKINGEISQQQKIVLITELTQLIYADNILAEDEEKAFHIIGAELKLDQEELKSIQTFIAAREIQDFNSVNVLIINSNAKSVPDKCQHIQTEGINGYIAILCLKSIKPFFLRYLGNSGIFLNQIPVEGDKVEIVPPGSVIRSNRFKAVYYSDILFYFKSDPDGAVLSFNAESVFYKFRSGKVALRDITIRERNGNMIGIMGASGSGKSTLLNVLNGNEKPASGRVLVNDINIHAEPHKIQGIIGYVPQDDLLIEDLTVYQNLYYAARLCFEKHSETEVDELVNKTLISLGLLDIKDFRVGNVLNKTISGGQRKRLNIGLELLREPMVMYVDEPTSGLSSRDSENIMDLLKELTLRGKLIFIVIHQPSSDIFKMFDRLLILDVGGYPIYYGNPVEAVSYFREAARLIDKQTGTCSECGNLNAEQIFNIIESRVVDEYGRHTEQRKITPETWYGIYKQKIKPHPIESAGETPRMVLDIPGRVKQFAIFTARDLRTKLANRQYILINLLEAPLLAIILAMLVRFHPGDVFTTSKYVYSENMNIPAYIFIAVIVALFMGLTVSAEEIIKDRKILKRESFLHLSHSSYLGSKLLLLFGLSAIQTASFVLVGNAILEIREMYFPYWIVLFSASCFANVLGLNISASFNSAITIYIIIPLLLIPQILLSGVVVQFDQLNPAFGSKSRVPFIGDLMISRWAYEAIIVNQFKNNSYEKIFYDVDKKIALADYHTVYYIPRLETMLDYVFRNRQSNDRNTQRNLEYQLTILRNELEKQVNQFGENHFTYFDQLTPACLDSAIYQSARDFLTGIKRVHATRNRDAVKEKELKIKQMTASPKKAEAYTRLRNEFANDKISSLLFDDREKTRVLEYKGRLVQQIYPIFAEPEPQHFFDFTTLFYMPKKHFAGYYFETLHFNVSMMWMMTAVLIITLYFDVLRKIITLNLKIKPKSE